MVRSGGQEFFRDLQEVTSPGAALQPLSLAGSVVALDGVEAQPQAAGAVKQADVPGTQVMDLLPAMLPVPCARGSC